MNIPDRIYSQYRNKPKAIEWFNVTSNIASKFESIFDVIRNMYDIDMMSGAQLDIIGRIVVLDRGYEAQITFTPYVWGGTKSQFGGKKVQFRNRIGKVPAGTSDQIYKILLKAKVVKNNSDSTFESILKSLSYITSISDVKIDDNEDMSFSIVFGSELDSVARFVLNNFDIIPRPQGVKFNGYQETPLITYFGGMYRWGDGRARFNSFIVETP